MGPLEACDPSILRRWVNQFNFTDDNSIIVLSDYDFEDKLIECLNGQNV